MTDERDRQEQSLREFLDEEDRADIEERLENAEGNVPRPPRSDPRHTDGNVTPGERNEPAGGSTGSYMGGSAKKRKGQAG
ncbi:MAG TPA: hypothetical protein VKZ96_10115 [Thermomicrobiales bacterium]|nr:hypothetical protein [Thermomicrobiales bacterium]